MNTEKLRILVVEDKPENVASAQRTLSGHSLIIVSGFDQAMGALNRGLNGTEYRGEDRDKILFDVVLTDCMFPKGGMACMGPEGQAAVNCQGEMPYGPLVVLHAIEAGIPHIGLITQGNHHHDPFVFGFDTLRGFTSEKVSVVITNCCDVAVHKETFEEVRYDKPHGEKYYGLQEGGKLLYVKDWKHLLDQTIGVVKEEKGMADLSRRQI